MSRRRGSDRNFDRLVDELARRLYGSGGGRGRGRRNRDYGNERPQRGGGGGGRSRSRSRSDAPRRGRGRGGSATGGNATPVQTRGRGGSQANAAGGRGDRQDRNRSFESEDARYCASLQQEYQRLLPALRNPDESLASMFDRLLGTAPVTAEAQELWDAYHMWQVIIEKIAGRDHTAVPPNWEQYKLFRGLGWVQLNSMSSKDRKDKKKDTLQTTKDTEEEIARKAAFIKSEEARLKKEADSIANAAKIDMAKHIREAIARAKDELARREAEQGGSLATSSQTSGPLAMDHLFAYLDREIGLGNVDAVNPNDKADKDGFVEKQGPVCPKSGLATGLLMRAPYLTGTAPIFG